MAENDIGDKALDKMFRDVCESAGVDPGNLKPVLCISAEEKSGGLGIQLTLRAGVSLRLVAKMLRMACKAVEADLREQEQAAAARIVRSAANGKAAGPRRKGGGS